MQTKIDFKKSLLRCLLVLLAVAVTVTMTPVNMEKAYGEEIRGDVLTVNDKSYTLAEIKGMDSVNAEFTYKNGSQTDFVKGVALSTLLQGCDENAAVTFANEDNYTISRQGMKVKDLAAANAVIAYQCGDSAEALADISDASKDYPDLPLGSFRLYTNNGKSPDKMIISIKVAESGSAGEDTPGTGGTEEKQYDLVITGNAIAADKYYTIQELKNDPGIVKMQGYEYSWTNKEGTDGKATVTGATVKNILEIAGIKTNYAKIRFEASDGYGKDFDVTEMYVEDMNKQIPMLAWKVDEVKTQRLIVGKNNIEDKNYSKWVDKITKIIVTVKSDEIQAPATLKAARASYNSVKLTWKAVDGADGYCVEKYDSKAKKFKEECDVTANSKTITKLNTGTEYKFRVKAYYSVDGVKTYSKATDVAKATPTLSKPAITKLTAGSKKITVKWTKVDGASGYKIYRATSKSGKYKLIKTVKSGKTTYYTNKSLTKGKKYYYKVKAYRNTASSSYSAVKYARAK